MTKKTQDAGDRGQGTGDRASSLSRRGWFTALAGLSALVAGRRRKRAETVGDKRRNRRLWIGHT